MALFKKKYPVVRMIIFFVLNILDLITTYWFVSLDGNTEAEGNPAARWLIERGWVYFISVKLAGGVIILVLLANLCRFWQKMGNVATTALVILFSLVVANNIQYYWHNLPLDSIKFQNRL